MLKSQKEAKPEERNRLESYTIIVHKPHKRFTAMGIKPRLNQLNPFQK